MKLLVLTSNFPRWEGDFAGVFLVRLLVGLKQHGIDSLVLAPHAKGSQESGTISGIPVIRFRYGSDEEETIAYSGAMQKQLMSLGGLFKFRRFLNKWHEAAHKLMIERSIDVVAGHWLIPTGMVLSRLARNSKTPIILSSHGTDLRLAASIPMLIPGVTRNLWENLHAWTVVSNYLASLAGRLHAGMADKIEVLPLPMNDELFSIDANVSRDPNLVVSVTKFTKQKRVDQFIHAIAKSRQLNQSLRAEIYGTGPDRDALVALIDQLNLRDSVLLREPIAQSALADVYRRAGVVVLNSVHEGFGAVLVEAMLCGAPVIGTNSGGIPDIIEHGQSGLLVAPDSVDELVAALVSITDDRTLASRLGQSGHDRAVSQFSSEVLIRRYAKIVRAAVSDARSGERQR